MHAGSLGNLHIIVSRHTALTELAAEVEPAEATAERITYLHYRHRSGSYLRFREKNEGVTPTASSPD